MPLATILKVLSSFYVKFGITLLPTARATAKVVASVNCLANLFWLSAEGGLYAK
jgi:hypothetical protein